MDAYELNPPPNPEPFEVPTLTLVDVFPEFSAEPPSPPLRTRRTWLPAVLFAATCVSTFIAGTFYSDRFNRGWGPAIADGVMYSVAVMTILLCHEMGHFLQACRYGVYASLPYFIPMPLTPLGTFGAVIGMDARRGNRKAIFDIGISGPLAGLVPTLIFLVVGLQWSHWVPAPPPGHGDGFVWGKPLLMQYLVYWINGPVPANSELVWHPVAFAGWVGLLITSINLVPIGQLDGGHVLYSMFREKANVVSVVLLVLAIAVSIVKGLTNWWLMLGLITFLGTRHPPTTDDYMPLGAGRYVLGILTLAFLFVGFTPVPISVN